MVQGHVDTVGITRHIVQDAAAVRMTFSVPKQFMRLIVPKGSIAVDGVSLTVTDIQPAAFTVSLVSYTLAHTNLKTLHIGDKVNIETDVLAKYMETLLTKK